MDGIQMRGYVVLSAADYLRKAAGEQQAAKLLAEASPQLRETIRTVKEATWCSATQLGELYRTIASLSVGDEDRTRTHLIECGKYTAREASNTFLRLVMKLLTPTLFAKKLPDLWSRDCTAGKIVVEVHEDRIRNRLTELGGFDHIAPVAVGYVSFALETMGKSITKVALHGWSLATPAPDESSFEVYWKN